MILTRIAKKDFEKYVENLQVSSYISMLENIPITYLNALIIDWFDSIGIYIEVLREPDFYAFQIHKGNYKKIHFNEGGFNSRQEATTEAIKKANEIYNSKQ